MNRIPCGLCLSKIVHISMVSSANISPGTIVTSRGNQRMLSVDFNKDFSKPLLVETSVEYDLPSHIYPPKGSAPILMIHPNPSKFLRTNKSADDSVAVSRPLSSLQINSNSASNRSASKPRLAVCPWPCRNPRCKSVQTAISNSRPNAQPQNTTASTTNRYVNQIPENIYSFTNKSAHHLPLSGETKASKKYKQIEFQQQLQQTQMQTHLNYEKAKLQAQQQSQQIQQQQHQQQKLSNNNCSRNPHNSTEQMAWNLSAPQTGNFLCCQHKIPGTLPPNTNHHEFLQPGIPPSLLARTPSRGASGSSPKLRARSRRGLSLASTVHIPEYLGSAARSSRMGSVCLSSHARTRSASVLSSTSNSQTQAIEAVRGLTSRFANNQQLQSGTLLSSLVGQSRDSGCSVSAEALNSTGTITSKDNIDWAQWGVVDSGFCTPVETMEDQVSGKLLKTLFTCEIKCTFHVKIRPIT